MATWTGAGLVFGPSEWELDISSMPNGSPEIISQAMDAAVSVIWRVTCERFPGVFPAAVRWFGHARCGDTRELNMEYAFAYPIVSVDAVVHTDSDGEAYVLPAESWRFERPNTLVKHSLDDAFGASFPASDRYLPHTAPGQWWIEATIGRHPPGHVLAAARQLARELVLLETDPEKCNLPDNIRSVSRQGTSIEFDRTAWASLPMITEIAKPWPEGYGCGALEYGVDPANSGREWGEIPWELLDDEPGS